MSHSQHTFTLNVARAYKNDLTLGLCFDCAHKCLKVIWRATECNELTRVAIPALNALIISLPFAKLPYGGRHATVNFMRLTRVLAALDAVSSAYLECV